MKNFVYLLEDDDSIAGLVKFSLEREGIDCRSFTYVQEFQKGLTFKKPDLFMIDVMLPDGNGLDVLKELKREYPEIPCIILSALGSETDKVKGLDLGADDYISKPFGVLEMVARVKAALRRVGGGKILQCGEISLDIDLMRVTLAGKELDLNRKEFELLKYCMRNPEVVLTREQLLTEVWGYVDIETRTLDNHIARLRKCGITNFETVFGVGYRFRNKQ